MFEELAFKEICLLSEKFFLNYSFIHFLSQQVNALKLVTIKAKLIIIINLKFLHTLIQLKKYLDMTDYLCQYIFHYIIIVKLLQLYKTLLNQCLHKKHNVIERNIQKWLINHINIITSISKKLNVFQHLQMLFLRSLILSHFDSKWQLYINLDVLKEFSFSAHIYYVKSRKSLINDFMTDTAAVKSDLMLSVNCNTFISSFSQKNVKFFFS